MQNDLTPNEQPKTFTRRDLHQQVTDTIITQLEAGVVPWHQPWTGGEHRLPGIPKNFETGNKYRGVNILLLWSSSIKQSFTSPEWATFKQWNNKNERIRKGEHPSIIVKYGTYDKKVDDEVKKMPYLKSAQVYNRCQLQSFTPQEEKPKEPVLADCKPLYRAEEYVENTHVTVTHGGSEAFYRPSEDTIHMPPMESFISTEKHCATEAYYATLMHELTHWSGAEKRLNRTKGKRFGDHNYATEELTAELGAAFLCAELEITTPEKADYASYIDHWLKVLKEDKKHLFTAAREASNAVDYLNSLQPPNPIFT